MNRTAINNRVGEGLGKTKKDARRFFKKGIRGSARDLEKIASFMGDLINDDTWHRPVRRKKGGPGFPVLSQNAEKIAALLSEADMRRKGWIKIKCPDCEGSCLEGHFKGKKVDSCKECRGLGFRWAQIFRGIEVREGVESVLIDGKTIPYDNFIEERQ